MKFVILEKGIMSKLSLTITGNLVPKEFPFIPQENASKTIQLPYTKETRQDNKDLIGQGAGVPKTEWGRVCVWGVWVEKGAERENQAQGICQSSLLLSLQLNTDQCMNLSKLPSQERTTYKVHTENSLRVDILNSQGWKNLIKHG